jgi:hypothetical protein
MKKKKRRTFASLSAARCAYMVGWSETLSMFVAWGSDERAQDRLGSAMSLSGETPLWEEGYGREDMGNSGGVDHRTDEGYST